MNRKRDHAAGLHRCAALLAALLFWLAAMAAAGKETDSRREPSKEAPYLMAWWGSLYPGLAMEDSLRLVGEETDGEISGDIPIKIKWKSIGLLKGREEANDKYRGENLH